MAKIRTYGGRLVDPFNPLGDDVRPHAFIHAISCINRFTGNSDYPYSVGQHTLNLIRYVPMHLKRAAMIHDWQEAWFNDLASPVKVEFPEYKRREKYAGLHIQYVMNVSHAEMETLDEFDKRIYVNERDAGFKIISEHGMNDDFTGLLIAPGDFSETPWRVIRANLWFWFQDLFPEWSYKYDEWRDHPFS